MHGVHVVQTEKKNIFRICIPENGSAFYSGSVFKQQFDGIAILSYIRKTRNTLTQASKNGRTNPSSVVTSEEICKRVLCNKHI